jgi:hypothetical protein
VSAITARNAARRSEQLPDAQDHQDLDAREIGTKGEAKMETQAPDPSAKPLSRVGVRSRLGGHGQPYSVVGMFDDQTALIEVPSWDEPLKYLLADVERDLAGDSTKNRFASLIEQYRSMGPDGPEYEVVSIESSTMAKIWVVGDEDYEDYEIQDILIDPVVYDGK